MNRTCILLLTASVTACTSQAGMDATQPSRVVSFSENYQAVYANLNKGARNCFTGSGYAVDGQLYSELGYGEVSAGGNAISYMPMMEAKVSKAGAGSTMQVKAAGIAKETIPLWAEYWARGGLRCPVAVFGETPPVL